MNDYHYELERYDHTLDKWRIADGIISKSLTPELIELRRIEAMQNFAKQGTHTVVLPQNTQSLIQLK